jgi:formate hydrogenlyase transcriptional activator
MPDSPRPSDDERLPRYEALLRISKNLATHKTIAELFEVLGDQLHQLVPFDYLALILHDESADRMRLVVLEPPELPRPPDTLGAVADGGRAVVVWQTQKSAVIPIPERGPLDPGLAFIRSLGRTVACWLPLTTAHGRLGVLNFGSSNATDYSPDIVAFMEQIAAHVAVAVDNSMNFDRLQRSREELTAERDQLRLLLDLNSLLITKHDLREVVTTVSESIQPVIPHTTVGLALYEPGSQVLCSSALSNQGQLAVMPPAVVLNERSPFAIALQRGAATLFGPEAIDASERDTGSPLRSGAQSLCCVPLITSRQTLGTLNIARAEVDAFDARDIELISNASAQIAVAVENALIFTSMADREERLVGEKEYLEDEVRLHGEFGEIVGSSPALRRMLKAVKTVSPTEASVLLLGETGTGKELVARAVHALSGRQRRSFVRVSAAAIPAGLIESELFGHEKGAFTGAVTSRPGRLELADGGTLFLDEVGDMALELQSKLLRVLQEREFERLGSTVTRRVDVRVIAATNRDLDAMVDEGTFRRDLYYRLSVFPIRLPPLRERAQDIPPLARYFVARYAQRLGRPAPAIPTHVLDTLCRWPWPGNIRELENVIQRAVILSTGSDLHVAFQEPPPGVSSDARRQRRPSLRDTTRDRVLQALRESHGVVGGPGGAAARLGLKRTTLQSLMGRLGIRRPSHEGPDKSVR